MSWPANPVNGQQVIVNGILYSYNDPNDTWDRIGFTSSAVTTEEIVLSKLTILERALLGDVANVRITGGADGQVLSTDGTGNLSWQTEAVLNPGGSNTFVQFNDEGTNLGGIANFAFDKTSNTLTVDYANLVLNAGASNQPNITTVGSLSNLEVTGNLTVYGNTDLQGNLHIGGTVISDGKISASAYTSPGSANQILFNKASNIDGSANLTFTNSNTLAVIGNITATKDVVAANLTGTLTLSASNQPNISNVGTLGNLTVTNNVVATNIKVAFANANIYNAPNSTTNTQILVNKAGNIGSYSNLFFDGNLLTVTGNIQSRNANLGNAVVANYFTGNITVGPQTGITSVGTLDSLTVTGNISSGNASLGNLATANYISGVLTSTSSSQPNITTVGNLTNLRVLGNANIDGNLYIGGTTIGVGGITAPSFTGNLNGNVTGVLTAPGSDKQLLFNKTGNVGASANITFTEGSGGLSPANLAVIGNITANAISVVNIISAPNISGTFTASSGIQPNIVSVGTLNSLTLDGGDATFRNTNIDITTNVKIRGPLIPTGFEEHDIGSPEHHWRDLYLAGNTIRVGSTTISATSQGGIVVSGSVTATGGVSSDTTASGIPLATVNATSTGGVSTITFAVQTVPPYSVGGLVTIAGLTPTGYNGTYKVTASTTSSVSYLKTVVGSQAVAGTVVSGGNPPFTVTSTLMVANLNVEQLQGYTPTTLDTANTIVQRDVSGSFQANRIIANSIVGTNPLIATVDIANTVLASFQPNITSTGTLISLDVLGTITAANLDIEDYVDALWVRSNLYGSDGYLGSNIVGEVAYASIANLVAGANVDGQVSNSAIAGTVYTNAQPNINSIGVLDSLHVAGDSTIDGDLYVGGVTVSAGGLSATTITGTIDGTFVSPGSNTEILFNKQGVIGADSDFAYNSLTKSLGIAGKLISVDADLGNLVEANYFKGNGYYLDHIQGLNIAGTVPLADKAGTVTSNAQPNINSTGILTTLQVSGDALIEGDLTVGGTTITRGGLSTSTLSINKGAIIIDQPFSINEEWSNSAVSFTSFQQEVIDTASDPTSLLAEFNVNNINVFKIDKTGNLWANDITAGNIAGTITYTNQPYITSLGELSSLDVTANIKSGNANLGNVAKANYFYGNATYLTGLPSPTEFKNENDSSNIKINVDSNITVSILGTPNTAIFSGSNLTIKDTIISANARLGDIVTANFFVGNGNSLARLTGANVTGYVPLATSATTAGTVTTPEQPAITSLGTLTSLATVGLVNATIGNSVTSNYFIGKFSAGSSSQPNITSVGTLTSLTTIASANPSLGNSVTSGYFVGNGYYLFNIEGSNVTGTVASATIATTASTVTDASQPSITSLGTLTSLSVSGTTTTQDITVTGNLTVSGDTITANVVGLVVKDPLIEMGGNLNGVLTVNDGYDRGAVMKYFDTSSVSQASAFMGWKNSEKEFTFASKATIATNLATIVDLGNIKAGNANIASNLKVGGNLIGTLALVSNNQPNISNVGKLIGLKVGNSTNFATHGDGTITTNGDITVTTGYYFRGDGSKLTGIDATSIKNGTSNVLVTPLNGNVIVTINNETIANIVSTGIVITGNANASSFNATSQFISTVATGTAPLVVNSKTLVPNLNVATAVTATNLAGGSVGSLPYQSAANTTAMLAAGADTNGKYLQSIGTSIQWATLNTDKISNGISNINIVNSGNIQAVVGGTVIANIASTGIIVSGIATANTLQSQNPIVAPVKLSNLGSGTLMLTGITSEVVWQIGNGVDPIISPSGNFIYYRHTYGISVIKLNPNGTFVGTEYDAITGLTHVLSFVFHPSGKFVFLQCYDSGNVVMHSYSVNQTNGTFTLIAPTISIGPTSLFVTTFIMHPNGEFIYFTTADATIIPIVTKVYSVRINQYSGQIFAPFTINSSSVTGECILAIDPAGRFLYIANRIGSTPTLFYYQINPITGALGSELSVSLQRSSGGVYIDPTGRFLYALSDSSSVTDLYRLDFRTGSPGYVANTFSIRKILKFDITGNFVYGTYDDGIINSYSINQNTGDLVALSEPSLTPINTASSLSIVIHPKNLVLYALTTNTIEIVCINSSQASSFNAITVTATNFIGRASSANIAYNLAGGVAGGVPYQTAAGTAITTAGTSGQVLTSGGAGAPSWIDLSSISNSTSTVSVTATGGPILANISGTTVANISSTGLTVNGNLTLTGLVTNTLLLKGVQQTVTSVPFTSAGTIATYLVSLGTIFYHSAATANWTANFTSLPTITGSQSRTTVLTIMVQQGATPYLPIAVTINSTTYTVKYIYGITPLGTANALDVFSFTVLQVSGAVTAVMGSYSTYL
jgi:6-phosphogluconolactonase (cycloisomerase 2 family)